MSSPNRVLRVGAIVGVLAIGGALAGHFVHGTHALVLLRSVVGRNDSTEAAVPSVFEGAFPGWQVTAFHRPSLVSTPGGVTIDGSVEPSGVFFRRKLDSRQVHRLVVRGIPRSKAFPGLRLRLDDHPYLWHPFDDQGNADLVLPLAGDLEVLLYADRPYSFDLRGLTAEQCPRCITAQILKDRIVAEAGVSPADPLLMRARKLRDWTANTVVFGLEPNNMEITSNAVVTNPPWQTYVDFFAPALGGVYCAGMAVYYQKILALFGLPSLIVGIGYNGTLLTHVTTVLVAGVPSDRHYYIFDPTFSGAYLKDDQYIEVLDLLRGEKAEFQTDPMSRRVLVPRAQLSSFLAENVAAQSHAVCDKESTIPDSIECRGFVDNNPYNLLMMRSVMKENGFPPDEDFILGLMRHSVNSINPSDIDPQAHEDFRKKLIGLGIPVRQP